jgi:hypothetical protein
MANGDVVPWTPLPYGPGGWKDYGSGWCPGTYTKDSAGWVTVRGLVNGANYTPNSTNAAIATLPVGCRPQYNEMFQCFGGDGASNSFIARIDVYPDGRLWIVGSLGTNYGSSNYQTLDGIRFYVGF